MTTRRVLFVLGYALLHVAAVMLVGLLAYGAMFRHWDDGLYTGRTTADALYGFALELLLFPLSLLGELALPAPLGYLAVYANGVLWGIALVAGWSLYKRRR